MDKILKQQLHTFQSACLIIRDCVLKENITLVNPPYCDDIYTPNGFPNYIKALEYVLIRDKMHHAKMELKICSSNSGISFDRIEIISIDSKPERIGMGTELFEQSKILAKALGINLIWGDILDDAAEFYKAMGCRIINNKFKFLLE